MSHKNQTNSYTEFYYHFFRNILVVSLPLLIISTLVLSLPHSSANSVDTLTLTLSSSCTMSSVVDIEHNGSLTSGTYIQNIGQTTIKTLCNDGNGYSVYAVGYSNNEEGNNKLINTEYPQYSIDTGLATSGLTSTWAMKLNNIPDDPSPTPPTIESDYNNTYGLVPGYWTKVASRASGTTDMDEGSSFTTTYAVYASSSQYAGTYNGQVKYLLAHPNSNSTPHFMQNIADWKNDIPNAGDTTLAMDTRDGKYYYVTRLADGHIWMTQNLDLDIDPAKPLTSNDTDLTDHSLTGAYTDGYNYDSNTGITTWTPERKTIDFQNTTVTGWTNDNNNPYSANKTDSTETGHTSLGNYYNWTAAIASNNSSALASGIAQNSICPKGWRLPIAANNNQSTSEFGELLYDSNITTTKTGTPALYKTDGFNNIISQPLWFILGGRIDETSRFGYFSTGGYYWYSTVYDNNEAYHIGFSESGVWMALNYHRGCGRPIRCIAQ